MEKSGSIHNDKSESIMAHHHRYAGRYSNSDTQKILCNIMEIREYGASIV